jgi:hypothetical protein
MDAGDATTEEASEASAADASCTSPSGTGAPTPVPPVHGWSWVEPAPTGFNYYAVWGTCGDAWVVGQSGSALHWNGTDWSWSDTGTNADLSAVFGLSPSDIWAVGDHVFVHYDGSRWSSVEAPDNMLSVWGAASGDVWAAGDDATFMTWDGKSWAHVKAVEDLHATFASISGSAVDNVWAAGNDGSGGADAVVKYDGKHWSQLNPLQTLDISQVLVEGPRDVQIFGSDVNDNPVILRGDGMKWSLADMSFTDVLSGEGITNAWGSSSQDIWLLFNDSPDFGIAHFDGTNWGLYDVLGVPDGANVSSAWSTASSEAFLVGDTGLIIHEKTHELNPTFTLNNTFFNTTASAIWGSASTDVWVAGANGVSSGAVTYHWNGDTLTPEPLPSTPYPSFVNGIGTDGSHSSSTSGVWAVGQSQSLSDGISTATAWHWQGSWSTYLMPGNPMGQLWAVWNDGSASDPVWAVGDGADIFEWTPSTKEWTAVAWSPIVGLDAGGSADAGVPPTLHAVSGSSDSDIWAVGAEGLMLHWDGSLWKQVAPITSKTLKAVWAISSGNVWAAAPEPTFTQKGNDTFVFHWNGTDWSEAKAPPSGCFHDNARNNYCSDTAELWSDGAKLYLLTDGGGLYENDGSVAGPWTQIGFPGGETENALGGVMNAGSSPTLWVGGQGTLRYYNQP